MKRLIPIIILIIIVLIFIGYYFLIINNASDWPTRGLIGDAFGFLNAFFGGIAIIGIVYTILQQNDIIIINKNDTEVSKNQFIASVHQFEQQQQIQALTSLISIYEKKLEQYKSTNDTTLIVQTDKKLTDLMTKLEEILT